MQDLCTSPVNLAGLPALSVPAGYTRYSSHNGCDGKQPMGKEPLSSSVPHSTGFPAEKIEGLPLAVQLIGQYGADFRLLQIGKWLETELNVPKIVLRDPL